MKVPPLPDGLDLKGQRPFRELRYKTADLFLHDLSPLGRLFGPRGPLGSRWLFRGLAKCGYTLAPSALRDNGAAKLFATDPRLWSHLVWTDREPFKEGMSRNCEQYEAERRVLCGVFLRRVLHDAGSRTNCFPLLLLHSTMVARRDFSIGHRKA